MPREILWRFGHRRSSPGVSRRILEDYARDEIGMRRRELGRDASAVRESKCVHTRDPNLAKQRGDVLNEQGLRVRGGPSLSAPLAAKVDHDDVEVTLEPLRDARPRESDLLKPWKRDDNRPASSGA